MEMIIILYHSLWNSRNKDIQDGYTFHSLDKCHNYNLGSDKSSLYSYKDKALLRNNDDNIQMKGCQWKKRIPYQNESVCPIIDNKYHQKNVLCS